MALPAADLFLIFIVETLTPGGRAAVVLPDGTLFGEGVKTRIKEHLLAECDLHTIVRLPMGVFAPYTSIKTNVLFFTKGQPPPTRNVASGMIGRDSMKKDRAEAQPLLDSAQQFLVEALNNYHSHRFSFAIVHAVTAVELLMKERLSRVHPRLVLADIDRGGEKTVSMELLPKRLAGFGLGLTVGDEKLVREYARLRNQIVHHSLESSPREASHQLPGLLDFATRFMAGQLHVDLKAFLPRDLYPMADQILSDWQLTIAEARASAKLTGSPHEDACLGCRTSGVLSKIDDHSVHCHLCGADTVLDGPCHGCGRLIPYDSNGFEEHCTDCMEAAVDEYIDRMSDFQRGK